jgi:hypothetical protein
VPGIIIKETGDYSFPVRETDRDKGGNRPMKTKTGWIILCAFLLLLSLKTVSFAATFFLTKNIEVTYRGDSDFHRREEN